jgi:hypothetical protein
MAAEQQRSQVLIHYSKPAEPLAGYFRSPGGLDDIYLKPSVCGYHGNIDLRTTVPAVVSCPRCLGWLANEAVREIAEGKL